jgi:hypothetical protein
MVENGLITSMYLGGSLSLHQMDCSTPALVDFGSEKLDETFLAPAWVRGIVTVR